MTDSERLELLIKNRDTVGRVFTWNTGLMHLCCASVYTLRGKTADEGTLKNARTLLKDRVGGFSNFHSTARDVIISLLDMSGNAETLLENALTLYSLLKQDFMTSSYLPMAAMILAEKADPFRYEEVASRTRRLYLRMRDEHPFLTSSEDSALCALLAMSEKSDDELIERMELCYRTLKPNFPLCGEQVQTLSHIMALAGGDTKAKCEKVLALIDEFRAAKHKWSLSYEIPILAILAEDPRPANEIVAAVCANDNWLAKQKGFGFWSSVSRMQRLMYAALMTQKDDGAASAAAVGSTVSAIVAEQVTMIAIIAAASSTTHHVSVKTN